MENLNSNLLHIIPMSQRLRVSVSWLRKEAEAGRIPHIKAGKVLLFNPGAVEKSLSKQASKEVSHAN